MSLPYPRFTDAEMQRRGTAPEAALVSRDVGHAVLYGAQRVGLATGG